MTAARDPRDLIEPVIRNALERWVEPGGTYYAAGFYSTDADNATEAVYDALRSAGLLVEPGGETRTEWGVWYPTDTTNPRWQMGSTPDAEQAAREHMADGYGERHSLKLVSRTVHYGPWQPATTQEEP